MALANYTDLVNSVTAWTHRADLTSVIPDFVKMAEVRIAQDLSVQPIEAITTFNTAIDTVEYAIPSDMVSLVRMFITRDGLDYELNGVDVDNIALDSDIKSLPTHYYIEANKIKLWPIPDAVYTVSIVYRKTLGLQASTTNAIMTKYPNIYLFATLVEAYNYIGGNGAAAKLTFYEQRYKQAIKDANRAEDFNDSNILVTELGSLIESNYRLGIDEL